MRIETQAFSDDRFALLGKLIAAGFGAEIPFRAAHCLGLGYMSRLWERLTQAGKGTISGEALIDIFGIDDIGDLLVAADLATAKKSDNKSEIFRGKNSVSYRIKGATKKRVKWLKNARESGAKGGKITKEKWKEKKNRVAPGGVALRATQEPEKDPELDLDLKGGSKGGRARVRIPPTTAVEATDQIAGAIAWCDAAARPAVRQAVERLQGARADGRLSVAVALRFIGECAAENQTELAEALGIMLDSDGFDWSRQPRSVLNYAKAITKRRRSGAKERTQAGLDFSRPAASKKTGGDQAERIRARRAAKNKKGAIDV